MGKWSKGKKDSNRGKTAPTRKTKKGIVLVAQQYFFFSFDNFLIAVLFTQTHSQNKLPSH